MGRDGKGWEGMGWEGMGRDGKGWEFVEDMFWDNKFLNGGGGKGAEKGRNGKI